MAEPLWRTPPGRLAPPHVYRMAGVLGAELRRLAGRFGPEAVAGLVPPVVRLLELLEALVAPAGAEGEAAAAPAAGRQEAEDPEQRLWEAERRERALHGRLARLEEQNRQLLGQLAESQSQEDSTARKEREVMLRLKEVVDKQRDELRAQAHEIVCKSRDTEALQEQLQRFMAMNEELRHKVAVVQAQLKSALEKKSDLEAAMLQTQRETSRRSRTASETQRAKPSLERASSPAEEPQHQDAGAGRSPAHCCFSKEELQQILQERNELKTNLFLVQEELAYYQRELLNEERVPSFFLDAMKSTIKRQRKKIRAKMLGTAEESASSGCLALAEPWERRRGSAATHVSLSPVTRGHRCHSSLRGCGKREARWWHWDHGRRQAGPCAVRLEAVQRRAVEAGSRDVPWRLCKTFAGSVGSNRLVTMGRGGPCRAPAATLRVCWQRGAKPALLLPCGSWISRAFGGFNKGLKGAELFCATQTCCLLVSGSLLAAGGLGVLGRACSPPCLARICCPAVTSHVSPCESWLPPASAPSHDRRGQLSGCSPGEACARCVGRDA
ncbi:rab-interacting lysosomal protein isoform X2 [Nyctibius grandis]|uniref:rab-interacting lysosomal protein isoform X2 n=1 Tax=Nyctibius grandis TaxID=48427 RepID=UPI0035BBFCD9